MQKITFEDTVVVKKPYITIDGIEHELQDGEYQGGTDLNADTFNTMQNNIENTFEQLNTYSTSEKVVGTYVDGKPIYRKTFTGSLAGDSLILENVDALIKTYGSAGMQGQKRPLMYYEQFNGLQYFLQIRIQNNNVYFSCVSAGEAYNTTDANITLEYTKTTD